MSFSTITEISPMAGTLATLGPQAATEITGALTNGDVSSARSVWRTVDDVPQRLIDLLDGNSGNSNPIAQLRKILTDPQLSDAGREQRAKALMDQLNGEVNEMAEKLTASLNQVEDELRAVALPPRPTGYDATLRIADSKSDLRMVLDPIEQPGAALQKVKTLLSRALANGDDAAAHVITSEWLSDYFEARWPNYSWREGNVEGISGILGLILDEHASPSVKKARQALAQVSSARGAVALRTMLRQLPSVVANIEKQARTAARR